MPPKNDRFASLSLSARKTNKPSAASALAAPVSDLSSDAPTPIQMRFYPQQQDALSKLSAFVAGQGRPANRARIIRAAISLTKAGRALATAYQEAEQSAYAGDEALVFELRLYAPQVEKIAELSASIDGAGRSIERQSIIRAAAVMAQPGEAFLRIYDELTAEDRGRLARNSARR